MLAQSAGVDQSDGQTTKAANPLQPAANPAEKEITIEDVIARQFLLMAVTLRSGRWRKMPPFSGRKKTLLSILPQLAFVNCKSHRVAH